MSYYRYASIVPNRIHIYDNTIYEDSKTESWVFGILKKQLIESGVTILKIKNFNGNWGFLLSNKDANMILTMYPAPIYKDGRIDWNATEARDRELKKKKGAE